MDTINYDALLIVSFGGPEGPDDVMPFLENVLRGRNVPRERMLEVAEHYQHFGGVSPINAQCRALKAAIEAELAEHGPNLPVYWGNRNWHPMLTDTLRQMRDDGVQRALAFMTSAFSSYSGCRQYREDVERAQAEVGDGAPEVDKLRMFFNHPGYIEPMRERVSAALDTIPTERHSTTQIVFTAHSLPAAMASGCEYENQLREACQLVVERILQPHRVSERRDLVGESLRDSQVPWTLVYQSRSGPPSQPWLEPDVCDYLREVHAAGEITDLVISPIGFISDHMEVVFDLDTEARQLCDELGLNMVRAETVGTHPQFISMIRELILERTASVERRSLGSLGPSHDVCPADCCLSGRPAR